MTKFQISNRTSGAIAGIYEAEDEDTALEVYAHDAGYDSFREAALISTMGGESDEEIEEMVNGARADMAIEMIAS